MSRRTRINTVSPLMDRRAWLAILAGAGGAAVALAAFAYVWHLAVRRFD